MNESDPLQATDAAPLELPPSARRMLRVVYIMGVILLLLFVTLIVAIIWKANHRAAPPPAPQIQSLGLGLPQGAEIRSASLNGDRLVVTTATEVIVVDVRKNAIISRISAGP
jgi:hypothetical protein